MAHCLDFLFYAVVGHIADDKLEGLRYYVLSGLL